MKKILLVLALIGSFLSNAKAQLGAIKGNALEISSVGGATGDNITGNTMMHKLWLYRNKAGNDWYSTSLHNGIAVDVSFLEPQVNTRTWWERNPVTGEQMWGDMAQTFMVLSGGNLGIGTTTPHEKLSVNGKIRAHEIKVEATDWPDYVFEEGYNVGTLKGLESYIKANKHLPEIPSAKEVEANGVALGEMNKLLLKKIEELTLHLIEKDKGITALETKNIQLIESQKSFVVTLEHLTERIELLEKQNQK